MGSAEPSPREQLLDAVLHTVGDDTFAASTPEMVCARAGLPRAEFDREFRDMQDACCQVYEQVSLDFLQHLAGAFGSTETWVEQMHALGVALYDYLLEDLSRARFIYVEFPQAGRRALALRDRTMRSLIALIDQGRYELDDPDSISRATAETVAGAVYSHLQQALREDRVQDAPQIMAELTYMSLSPYLGPEGAAEVVRRPLH